MGTRRSPAYQKMTNASGNQGEPRSFFTTLHAESRIAKLMTNQRIRPPIPISTTRVPKPLSTPTAGRGAGKEAPPNFGSTPKQGDPNSGAPNPPPPTEGATKIINQEIPLSVFSVTPPTAPRTSP